MNAEEHRAAGLEWLEVAESEAGGRIGPDVQALMAVGHLLAAMSAPLEPVEREAEPWPLRIDGSVQPSRITLGEHERAAADFVAALNGRDRERLRAALDAVDAPASPVWHPSRAEWDAAVARHLAELGTTMGELAEMHRTGDWASTAHREAWVFVGPGQAPGPRFGPRRWGPLDPPPGLEVRAVRTASGFRYRRKGDFWVNDHGEEASWADLVAFDAPLVDESGAADV